MPVTVKRYLQGSQLLGNLLSVSGVYSCPTLSQSRRRPPPMPWRNAPARPTWWGAEARRRDPSPGTADSESSGRCGRARTPARESDTVREAEPVARRRTALCGSAGFRRVGRTREAPDRACHGMRRGRAVLLRLRTVVCGGRDCGAGGRASPRRTFQRRAPSRPARHDDALRRTPEQTGSTEVGRRRGWRRPGPPDVHEPRRARRGPHPSRRLQFNVITARNSPGSLSA